MLEYVLIGLGVFIFLYALIGSLHYVFHNKRAIRERAYFKKIDSFIVGTTNKNEIKIVLSGLRLKEKRNKLVCKYYYFDPKLNYKKIGESAILYLDKYGILKNVKITPRNKYSYNLDYSIDGIDRGSLEEAPYESPGAKKKRLKKEKKERKKERRLRRKERKRLKKEKRRAKEEKRRLKEEKKKNKIDK